MIVEVTFSETNESFETSFDEVIVVERVDIPSRYGLITYTQDRIITVT